MDRNQSTVHIPPRLAEARMAAWASLVDTGIEGMLALQARLHPDRDARLYVREAIRQQAEDSHLANIHMLERVERCGE